MSLRYLHLDVFTNRPLEGNQLAVFPEPAGLSTATMQAVTKEMNFSECTFIFPAEGTGDVRMRIFTPHEELPMAGHPTIGSTFALAAEGVIARGRRDFLFELGVGPIPVSLEWSAGTTRDGAALSGGFRRVRVAGRAVIVDAGCWRSEHVSRSRRSRKTGLARVRQRFGHFLTTQVVIAR